MSELMMIGDSKNKKAFWTTDTILRTQSPESFEPNLPNTIFWTQSTQHNLLNTISLTQSNLIKTLIRRSNLRFGLPLRRRGFWLHKHQINRVGSFRFENSTLQ